MGFNEFTLQVALVFYPGFVCAKFFDMLAHRPRRYAPELLVSSFVFGVTIYLAFGWIGPRLGLNLLPTEGMTSMANVYHLTLMTGSAIGVAMLRAAGYNYKWLNRLGAWLRVTQLAPQHTCWAGFF